MPGKGLEEDFTVFLQLILNFEHCENYLFQIAVKIPGVNKKLLSVTSSLEFTSPGPQ